jgi:hypothetical protein
VINGAESSHASPRTWRVSFQSNTIECKKMCCVELPFGVHYSRSVDYSRLVGYSGSVDYSRLVGYSGLVDYSRSVDYSGLVDYSGSVDYSRLVGYSGLVDYRQSPLVRIDSSYNNFS